MSVKTRNIHGEIVITDEAIAIVAAKTALESYGVVSLATKSLKDSLTELNSKNGHNSGVKIKTLDNHIEITIYLILKYGVSLEAVCESIKKNVKYNVEKFTNMIVDCVDLNVMGVRV